MFKLGITGCGRVTEKIYFNAISEIADVKIVAVADPLEERRKIVFSKFPECKVFNSLDSLLKNTQIDGLVIASPSKFHVSDVIKAVDSNVPVLVEKPLATDTEQLYDLDGLTNVEKKTIMIGFNRRFWDPIKKLKKNIFSSKVIGEYSLITNYASWDPIEENLDPLDDLMHHQIDLIRFIINTEIKKIEILDRNNNIFNIILENGSVFKLISNHSNKSEEYLTLKVEDKKYYLKSSSNRISPHDSNIRSVYDKFEKYVRLFEKRKSSFNLSYNKEIINFMKSVINNQNMSPGIEDGIIPVKIIEKIRKSAYDGEQITIK